MAGFDCDEREERRFNLAHHHQLTYEPILQHHDQLCNRFQVTKSRFSGELRRCCRAPVGFVFLWPFTAPAGQWRRPTDPPAQCAVMIGCTGSCGDRRQQFPAAEGAVVPSRWGGRALLRPRSRLPFAVACLRQPQQAFDAHAPLQGQPLRSRAQCHHSTSPMWHPAGWVSPWCWLLRAAAGNGHGNGSRHPHAHAPQPTGMPMPTGHRAPSPPPQLGPAARGPIQYS